MKWPDGRLASGPAQRGRIGPGRPPHGPSSGRTHGGAILVFVVSAHHAVHDRICSRRRRCDARRPISTEVIAPERRDRPEVHTCLIAPSLICSSQDRPTRPPARASPAPRARGAAADRRTRSGRVPGSRACGRSARQRGRVRARRRCNPRGGWGPRDRPGSPARYRDATPAAPEPVAGLAAGCNGAKSQADAVARVRRTHPRKAGSRSTSATCASARGRCIARPAA